MTEPAKPVRGRPIKKGQKLNKKTGLTPKQRRFVVEYLIDLNQTAAAIRAGYSERTAREAGYELMRIPQVKAAVQAEMAKRAERTQITADNVMRTLWAKATADARELVEFRRGCCRYCWGKGYRYQRTANEMERARAAHAAAVAEAKRLKERRPPPFDEQGGIGYHAKREPNQDCPECFGDGIGEAFIHDTRKLSPEVARLYAGVKQTKEGIEVKMLSQDDALRDVGRHLGLFTDKHELTGAGGGPVQLIKRVIVAPK